MFFIAPGITPFTATPWMVGTGPGKPRPPRYASVQNSTATDGAVVVFHTDREDTAVALPDVLSELGARFKLGTLSELGMVPSPRLDLHPDFAGLEINPGYIRPKASGRWRSLNLLELGAAQGREPNMPQAVAESGGSRLDLITGDPSAPFEQPASPGDRHLLVLAGEVSCQFAAGSGQELGTVLARRGDLVLWPSGAAARLSSGRRWTGALLHTTNADDR